LNFPLGVTFGCIYVQITALGNPKLLERVAAGLMAVRNLFSQFDLDMNNVITREEFIKVSQQPHMCLFPHDSSAAIHSLAQPFAAIVISHTAFSLQLLIWAHKVCMQQ